MRLGSLEILDEFVDSLSRPLPDSKQCPCRSSLLFFTRLLSTKEFPEFFPGVLPVLTGANIFVPKGVHLWRQPRHSVSYLPAFCSVVVWVGFEMSRDSPESGSTPPDHRHCIPRLRKATGVYHLQRRRRCSPPHPKNDVACESSNLFHRTGELLELPTLAQ